MESAEEKKILPNSRAMTIIAHLEEFRVRLIRCGLVVVSLAIISFIYSQDIIEWVKREFCPELETVFYTRPLELFTIKMKVALYLALVAGVPYIAYEVWKFVSPGLFKNERKPIVCYALASTFFFLTGSAFALFFVYPSIIRFSLAMSSEDIVPLISVESFINLAAMMVLGFGLMFQLPLIVFSCVSFGIIEPKTMAKMRPYVIVGILVISAVMTPPDVLSQLAMALPTYALFEISLLFARCSPRRKRCT